jgi:Fic-DOC domain mobile mystery protein B
LRIFNHQEGSTPIEDASGLIPEHISAKKELDEWESENILAAVRKYLSRKTCFEFSAESIKRLHKDMFDRTWKWAGQFRQKDFNIGMPAAIIPVEIKKLTDDVKYWSDKNVFDIFGQSIRIHHRLVMIHPFENGNGRHARLTSDIILHNAGEPMPKWPEKEIVENTGIRKEYIDALKNADNGDYKPLENFTRNMIKSI